MRQLPERQTKFGMDLEAISSNQSGGSNQSEWGYGVLHVCEAWDIFIPTKWCVKIRTLREDGVLYHRWNILYCNQQYDLDWKLGIRIDILQYLSGDVSYVFLNHWRKPNFVWSTMFLDIPIFLVHETSCDTSEFGHLTFHFRGWTLLGWKDRSSGRPQS